MFTMFFKDNKEVFLTLVGFDKAGHAVVNYNYVQQHPRLCPTTPTLPSRWKKLLILPHIA